MAILEIEFYAQVVIRFLSSRYQGLVEIGNPRTESLKSTLQIIGSYDCFEQICSRLYLGSCFRRCRALTKCSCSERVQDIPVDGEDVKLLGQA